jgi:hypothetical protein
MFDERDEDLNVGAPKLRTTWGQNHFRHAFLLFFSIQVFLLLFPLLASAQSQFEVVKVADGVYAALRKEPELTVNANSVFIINDTDVVAVDMTLTPGTAKESLAALRERRVGYCFALPCPSPRGRGKKAGGTALMALSFKNVVGY